MLETPTQLPTTILGQIMEGITQINEENKVVGMTNLAQLVERNLQNKMIQGNAEVYRQFGELKEILESGDLAKLKSYANSYAEAAKILG
jgi:hypothetical protein